MKGLQQESYTKGIIYSISLNVIGKLLFFGVSLGISRYFNTTDTDIYFYITSTITLVALFINGADSAVIVPEAMTIRGNNGIKEEMKFLNTFFIYYIIFSIAILLFFLMGGWDILIQHRGTKGSYPYIVTLSSVLIALMILVNFLTTILASHKLFTIPIIANCIANLCALISLFLWKESFSISSVLLGSVLGYTINLFILIYLFHKKLNWQFNWSIQRLENQLKKKILFTQCSNVATFAYNYGLLYILGTLGTGALSAYSYSQQIISIPTNFIITQFSSVVAIKFNELAAQKDFTTSNKIFQESTTFLCLLLVPICFITNLLSEPIISTIFKYGNFNEEAVVFTSFFLKTLIFLLPYSLLVTLLSRVLQAHQKVNESFYFQLFNNFLFLITIFLVTQKYNTNGLVYGIVTYSYLYISIVCFYQVAWLIPFIKYTETLRGISFQFILNFIPYLLLGYLIKVTGEVTPLILALTFICFLIPFIVQIRKSPYLINLKSVFNL
jgi:putative peptidoglycan lipid II flippase